MKVCLAFMMLNEAHWLKLHLPSVLQAFDFDGIVALDGGSTDDSVDVSRQWGAKVHYRDWDWNFGAHANALLLCAESDGFDVILQTAPDELWGKLPDLRTIPPGHGWAFPRYNFVADRLHLAADPAWYPDYQVRAWNLNQGIRFRGAVHEMPQFINIVYQPAPHIYHYGFIAPLRKRKIQYENYRRIVTGEPFVQDIPDEMVGDDYPARHLFQGWQPLDPQKIGIKAPYI